MSEVINPALAVDLSKILNKSAEQKAKLEAQQELEGTRLGVQIAKDRAQQRKPVRSQD